MIRIGLDIGSTTAKIVAIGNKGEVLHSHYRRHNAQAHEVTLQLLSDLLPLCCGQPVSLRMTGSVGMGFSERFSLPFVQEVVAATHAIKRTHSSIKTMIDIGGEDAKVVFFKNGEANDMRMNGNCAGGTGAFIDQMAILLNVEIDKLDTLAAQSTHTYPIASRCGVFSKTDIQNLIAKNTSREDVAASIFHAVAVQTVTTLARGCDIEAPVLMCGGPLTFIPSLRRAFINYLQLDEKEIILPEMGELLPAMGAAIAPINEEKPETLLAIIDRIGNTPHNKALSSALTPIFSGKSQYASWLQRMSRYHTCRTALQPGSQKAFIGIDSGSTTTKVVVVNEKAEMLFSYYKNNGGNPIQAVAEGLNQLSKECQTAGTVLEIAGSCSTGYGEDLIKAAFSLDAGIIETIAHYMAASHLDPQVSFILDIGGQDMKAIFVNNGVIDHIELNEACSSGCGSFIETFARSLGYSTHEFAMAACRSAAPCDLGSRCTVFMNSKVKQVLREGATVSDISAGLAYSVVKNCLYKVLKLKDTSILGKHIVVQGGTMRNDAIVRAIELLTGAEVSRCDCPELMGAYGCALYAMKHVNTPRQLTEILSQASFSTQSINCHGCENNCIVQSYRFASGKHFHSGNRCEKVFNNGGTTVTKGENAYIYKNLLLFSRGNAVRPSAPTVGIPRVLNTYEEYPFWHTLFTQCGINVCLSEKSNFSQYEQCTSMVMSDNICFPAKVVHSHIVYLQEHGVNRIFMPFVVHEAMAQNDQNSYNCPIVTGYSTVIKSSQSSHISIDSPVISFKDRHSLHKQCTEYLSTTFGISKRTITSAFKKAEAELENFHTLLAEKNCKILRESQEKNELCILLAGRPYHSDPLIQHNVAEMLAGMGINVITDDIVRGLDKSADGEVHYLSQWSYPNRILRAAKWCAMQGDNVQMVQTTSFGCGPDAFLNDEVRDLLLRHHKSPTLLKLDDINNVGSMKLRLRSMIESLKLARQRNNCHMPSKGFVTTPVFDKTYRKRKILVPFFTSFLSPLVPAMMKLAGYDVANLPLSDQHSCDWGLKYANNEVCYPATLIVGDIIKAFKSGSYDPAQCAVAITQTGGQCRASNYVPLIKKALVDAGYSCVPVVSLTFGDDINNNQPAFHINWFKMLPVALRAILFSDCISKFYYATAAREIDNGYAAMLAQLFLQKGAELIEQNRSNELIGCLANAAEMFDRTCTDADCPRVGIVGEIFLKFNPFAQKNVSQWLTERHIEVMPPLLIDFFLQAFVNRKVNVKTHIEHKSLADALLKNVFNMVQSKIEKVNRVASRFRYFVPFGNIFNEAEAAKDVITLNAQFGEGWLLPAEIIAFARSGVNNVISLQPFGCIANHIVSKGVEKRIKALYPDMNLLSLDFDSGVSDVNITNRLLLFIDKLIQHEHTEK